MLKVSAACVVFAVYPAEYVCCRHCSPLEQGGCISCVPAAEHADHVRVSQPRARVSSVCSVKKHPLINVLGLLYLPEAHKYMKMQVKLIGKSMVFSFFH